MSGTYKTIAQELFIALRDLAGCEHNGEWDFTHMDCGTFDLITTGDDYDGAIDILKKYKDVVA